MASQLVSLILITILKAKETNLIHKRATILTSSKDSATGGTSM